MVETIAGISFWLGCNVLYYSGAALLLAKNCRRDARIAGIGAFLIGPLMIFFPVAQLLFVAPLYTLFAMHGLALPAKLPMRSILSALGMTTLCVALPMLFLVLFYG